MGHDSGKLSRSSRFGWPKGRERGEIDGRFLRGVRAFQHSIYIATEEKVPGSWGTRKRGKKKTKTKEELFYPGGRICHDGIEPRGSGVQKVSSSRGLDHIVMVGEALALASIIFPSRRSRK